jgi:hypothetical protein
MDLTLTIDGELVPVAENAAKKRGISLEELIRLWIEQFANSDESEDK